MSMSDKELTELREKWARGMGQGSPDVPPEEMLLYEDDLRDRADRAGQTVEAVRARDSQVLAQHRFPTPQCLRPDELQLKLRNSGKLSVDSARHLETCGYCQAEVKLAQPTEDALRQLGESAAQLAGQRRPGDFTHSRVGDWVQGGFTGLEAVSRNGLQYAQKTSLGVLLLGAVTALFVGLNEDLRTGVGDYAARNFGTPVRTTTTVAMDTPVPITPTFTAGEHTSISSDNPYDRGGIVLYRPRSAGPAYTGDDLAALGPIGYCFFGLTSDPFQAREKIAASSMNWFVGDDRARALRLRVALSKSLGDYQLALKDLQALRELDPGNEDYRKEVQELEGVVKTGSPKPAAPSPPGPAPSPPDKGHTRPPLAGIPSEKGGVSAAGKEDSGILSPIRPIEKAKGPERGRDPRN